MSTESEQIYFMPKTFRTEPGYSYAWGLGWQGRDLDLAPRSGRSAYAHVYLFVQTEDAEKARNNWKNHLEGAQIRADSYNGFIGHHNHGTSPIVPGEANSLAIKLKPILDGKRITIYENDHPIERTSAITIAHFLEPRIKLIPQLTPDGQFYIPLSSIDALLPKPEKTEPTIEYYQSMFKTTDLAALEITSAELGIPVVILAEKEGQILVEVQKQGDLSEFWETFDILRDTD